MRNDIKRHFTRRRFFMFIYSEVIRYVQMTNGSEVGNLS